MFLQGSFLNLNQNILFKEIIILLKIWKRTGSIAFSTSLKIWNSTNEWKKLLFCFIFLIFLFIITGTKIPSKLWEKCWVFQLSFHLAITFHSCYFWKSWALQLYFSVWHIELKTNLKSKSNNTVFEMSLLIGFKYPISLQLKVQGAFFAWGIMYFIIQSALLDYSFPFLILVCYISLVWGTSNFQIVAIVVSTIG